MRSIENWLRDMSCNKALTFMLQLGTVGTPFPTMIVQANAEAFHDVTMVKPSLATDHDMVVVRRFYTA